MSVVVSPEIVVPPADSLPRTGVGRHAPGWWGMLLFCVSEVALFAYFLVSYAYLRGAYVAFAANGGAHPSLGIPALLTVLLVGSSLVLRWGERGIERGDNRRLVIALIVTILLGAAFLVTQGAEYAREQHMPQTDAYWSTFYAITGTHGAHVALGILMLAFNLMRAIRGHFSATRRLAIQNGALYWHTVDLVWLLILFALYLAPYLA